ncbi:MAG TPA: glycine betaine ABC transporter substrate-binding protein [Candidatus Eisenbacteria bacterium]|nr:glycine betaine ABC transporter substrate-binding protein [Candidatus Eisenbacteria bacterium]
MSARVVRLARLVAFAAGLTFAVPVLAADDVVVGSKAFAESWILADALAAEMRAEGVPHVTHRRNLGGTEIVYQALRSGGIDVYPEYTGTVLEVILQTHGALSPQEMRAELAKRGIAMSDPIGFDDSYAIAVSDSAANRYGLAKISDLLRHPELRLGLTHEFLGRPDGWPGLARAYGLRMRDVRGIQHELAYEAVASGMIDATDIYTTDAQIERLHLRVLEDDRRFFPRYDAVWLYRSDLPLRQPRALAALLRLTGSIGRETMIRANARVALDGAASTEAAEDLRRAIGLGAAGRRTGATAAAPTAGTARSILQNTVQHVKLVLLSLLAAALIGVPLGVMAANSRSLGGILLGATGLAQTIPSLALLAMLIPLFGVGVVPALIALFVYSLLPIVRNTSVGLTTIPPPLLESAACLPLTGWARLLRIRLPLASPAVLAGLRTSAVINVGSATLAALIGAGGLGEPILTGIQLRRNDLILQGAIPAALLALLVERVFDGIERLLVPKGLRVALPGQANPRRRDASNYSRIGGDPSLEEAHDNDGPTDRPGQRGP